MSKESEICLSIDTLLVSRAFKSGAQSRLAAIDGDDGYTGVKPQQRYVTCPPWHRPSPSFRYFFF